MAKGARASTRKSNNSKLKSRVFGPVETARTERLSAKLLELASLPRPSEIEKSPGDVTMEIEPTDDKVLKKETEQRQEQDEMETDLPPATSSTKSKGRKSRIEKRKSGRSKASIVFPKYKNGKRVPARGKR